MSDVRRPTTEGFNQPEDFGQQHKGSGREHLEVLVGPTIAARCSRCRHFAKDGLQVGAGEGVDLRKGRHMVEGLQPPVALGDDLGGTDGVRS